MARRNTSIEVRVHNSLTKDQHEAWLLKVAKLIIDVKVKEIIENASIINTDKPNENCIKGSDYYRK